MFDMSQSNANKWIHVLLPVLYQTLIDLGDAPARHLQALAQRLTELGVSAPTPPEEAPGPAPFFTTGVNVQSRAPKTQVSKAHLRAARKSAIR
jgi:hypothetical protein